MAIRREAIFLLVVVLFLYNQYPHNEQFATIIGNNVKFDDDGTTVEELMYKFKSDKSRDDHGYSKFYQMLFSHIRHSVVNVTEVGIAAGQSIQAWHRYFPNADIHGFDIKWYASIVKTNMEKLPRFYPHIVNILDDKQSLTDLGFEYESMDIIIEDGPHSVESQELFLLKLFPFLKPNGYYIIEDVGAIQGGLETFHNDPSKLLPETRAILEENDAIFVDAALGHRAWDEWVRRSGRFWAKNRIEHNSYLVVIQKRDKPLKQPMQMNFGHTAMKPGQVVIENSTASDVHEKNGTMSDV